MTTAPTTVATFALMSLKPDTTALKNINQNQVTMITRAMEVFIKSYTGYELCGERVNQMYRKYRETYAKYMMKVFGIQLVNLDNTFENIKEMIKNDKIVINIAVLKAKGIDNMLTASVGIEAEIGKNDSHCRRVVLNPRHENQTHPPFSIEVSLQSYAALRAENSSIHFEVGLAEEPQHCHKFVLPYRDIHVEGFTDWLEFVIGERNTKIQVLIKVTFSSITHKPNKAEYCHIQMFVFFLKYKLQEFRDKHMTFSKWHTSYASKRKTDCLRKAIKPNTESAFWSKPVSFDSFRRHNNDTDDDQSPQLTDEHFLQSLRREGLFGRSAKYHDLSIGYNITEDMTEETFCICNEWCNLSAFFYHNPIIRFVMLQHNQLYFTNNLMVSDIYMFAVSYLLTFKPQATVERTPLFGLLQSSHKYSEINYSKSLIDRKFAKQYNSSRFLNYLGLAYKLLRYEVSPSVVSQITEKISFGDYTINCVHIYYDVLNNLHNRIGDYDIYVMRQQRKEWSKELENDSRKFYHNILSDGMNEYQSGNCLMLYEPLYSHDYGMQSYDERMTSSDVEKVMKYRNKVLVIDNNPFNIEFVCERHLSLIISLSNFIVGVEPSLTKLYKSKPNENQAKSTLKLDDELHSVLVNNQNDNNFAARISVKQSNTALVLPELCYYQFYTLKTYSVAYNLQKYCFDSIKSWNEKITKWSKFSSKDLKFVFRSDWIELSLKCKFTDRYMFKSETQQLTNAFTAFYATYWKLAKHETNTNLTNNENYESILFEYQRLYHWWKMNGSERMPFSNIEITVKKLIEEVMLRVELIYKLRILKIFRKDQTRYDYKIEIIDLLVYWLIRADCFLITQIADTLIKRVFELQSFTHLQRKDRCFTQTKPGLCPLIRLYKVFLVYVNRIQRYYIQYDDEFNRIANTINDTKTRIKELFRDVYRKLSLDFRAEIEFLFTLNKKFNRRTDYLITTVIKLHLIAGTTFFAYFGSDFRKQLFRFRYSINHINVNAFPNPYSHQKAFIDFWKLCKDQWFKQSDELMLAMPFMSTFWRQHMSTEFAEFNKLDPITDLNIL